MTQRSTNRTRSDQAQLVFRERVVRPVQDRQHEGGCTEQHNHNEHSREGARFDRELRYGTGNTGNGGYPEQDGQPDVPLGREVCSFQLAVPHVISATAPDSSPMDCGRRR